MRTERVCSASALSTAWRTHHTAYGDELHALVGIELFHGLEEPFVADGDELTEIEPVALILLHVRDDETEIRGYEPLRGDFVALLREAGEPALFGGVSYERELLYVVEVLIESGRGGRAEKPFRPALGHMLHTRPVLCGRVDERHISSGRERSRRAAAR